MNDVPSHSPEDVSRVSQAEEAGSQPLTEEQRDFAAMLGRLLAARWAETQAVDAGDRRTRCKVLATRVPHQT